MRDYRLNGAVSHPTFDWQRTSVLEQLRKTSARVYLKPLAGEIFFFY
jgi:hypothetical protein